ncbi:MAG: penicillin-binding protein 2 [Pseudomonadota bacterium]
MLDFSINKNYQIRKNASIIIILILFLILLFRLFFFQILKGDVYKSYSDSNRIFKENIPGPRGIIYDRNTKVIVGNRSSFDLTLTRAYTKKLDETLTYLEDLINDKVDFQIDRIKEKIKRSSYYRPVTILKDIPWDVLAIIESQKYQSILDGLNIKSSVARDYKYDEIGAHLLGYLGEVTKENLNMFNKEDSEYQYIPGQFIGKFGLERKFEPYLRGQYGVRPSEVDAHGRIQPVSEYNRLITRKLYNAPVKGMNLTTTIDIDLQLAAYEAFEEGESGSIVALDTKTGEILAMVSYPSFNPKEFSRGINHEQWKDLNSDPLLPLIDKTVRGLYPPGSTFKMIVALAALQEGIIDSKTKFYCPGHLRYGGRDYRCWKKGGHGKVGVVEAIQKSCDVFFYNLATKLGVDTIAKYANHFGLGSRTGINLNFEKAGFIPTSEWKKATYKEKWYGGETLSLAIGQGYTLTTTLQLALMAAIIANNGKKIKPSLFKNLDSNLSSIQLDSHAQNLDQENISIDQENMVLIKEGMFNVVNKQYGTAYWYGRSKKYHISGKTGTAQVVSMKVYDKKESMENNWLYEDHALFVSFAPSDDPKISVSVIVEHGGHGSSSAAPKAKKVIEFYLDKLNASI